MSLEIESKEREGITILQLNGRITMGEAQRGVAHASSGPCLQQNLVCVLEGN